MSAKVNKRRKKPKASKARQTKSVKMSLQGAMRILAIALIFGAGLFSLTLGFEKLSRLPVFEVREIHWVGLQHLKVKKMKKQFHTVFGQNLFQVDIKAIHQRLSSNQWIKSATVKKEYPNKLLVIVVERKPASVEYEHGKQSGTLVDFSSAPYLIDQEGVTLQQGGRIPPNLPQMLNVNLESYASALSIGALLKERRGVYIDLSDSENLRIFFTDSQSGQQIGLLHLGKNHFQEKWQKYLRIEPDLEKHGFSTWEIDLRFSNKAIAKKGVIQRDPGMYYF